MLHAVFFIAFKISGSITKTRSFQVESFSFLHSECIIGYYRHALLKLRVNTVQRRHYYEALRVLIRLQAAEQLTQGP